MVECLAEGITARSEVTAVTRGQAKIRVTVLYNKVSSCVFNNGFATKHFNLGRGIRQGCPLSGILFVIGTEILRDQRNSD